MGTQVRTCFSKVMLAVYIKQSPQLFQKLINALVIDIIISKNKSDIRMCHKKRESEVIGTWARFEFIFFLLSDRQKSTSKMGVTLELKIMFTYEKTKWRMWVNHQIAGKERKGGYEPPERAGKSSGPIKRRSTKVVPSCPQKKKYIRWNLAKNSGS